MSGERKTPDLERKILSVALSTEEAADMVMRAGKEGTPVADFLGTQVRRGAYGHMYAETVAAQLRPNLGHVGTGRDAREGDA
ncbi:hypothetical protein ACUXAV_000217 [Cupriavidus metallidurans]|jgi:hypothetical protein|uniref:hypothetical protein n=1 Tax=Cupriavidus TaxID=106589 RepID=UPI00049324D6|nr:hypothetical protein [Cupriavidus metallidurans]MDE4918180.1 hypothetical protein [Cupriavidus metallidurans]